MWVGARTLWTIGTILYLGQACNRDDFVIVIGTSLYMYLGQVCSLELYNLILLLLLLWLTSLLLPVPTLRDLFYRESMDGLYQPPLFVLAYFLHVLPFTLVTSMLFGSVGYWWVKTWFYFYFLTYFPTYFPTSYRYEDISNTEPIFEMFTIKKWFYIFSSGE